MVLAADDVGDFRVYIVANRRQGIEIAAILTDQDRVGQGGRLNRDRPAHHVFPLHRIARQFETPVRLAAFRFQLGLVGIGEVQRSAVIDRRAAIGHLQAALALELVTGLITGIEQTLGLELVCRSGIAIKPFGLFERLVPFQTQPGQVGPDTVLIFLRRALDIRIVDPQHKSPARLARKEVVEQRGAHIADMKLAGRAGSETDFGHGKSGLRIKEAVAYSAPGRRASSGDGGDELIQASTAPASPRAGEPRVSLVSPQRASTSAHPWRRTAPLSR